MSKRIEAVMKEIADRFSDEPAKPTEVDPAKPPETKTTETTKAPEVDPAKPPETKTTETTKAPEVDPAKPPETPKTPEVDPEDVPDFTKRSESDARQRESLAQQRAAENGRKLKQVEQTLAEKEAEIAKLREEVAKKSAPAQQMPREEEILALPEISRIRESVASDVRSVAMTQDNEISSSIIMGQYARYIGGWVEGGKDEPTEFRKMVREDFLTAYRASAEHDPDSETQLATEHVKSVLALVVRNETKVAEIQKKVEETINRAKEGVSTIGFQHWKEQADELKGSAFSVMDIPEDADPHSVAAFIKGEISQSDEAKSRFEKIVDAVTTAIIGPRVLTETELKAVENSGISLKEYHKRRSAKHLDNRKKLVAQIAQALYVVNQFPDLYRDALDARETRDAQDQLRGPGIKDRKPEAPAPVEKKPVTRETFVSSIEKFLGGDEK